MPEPHTPGTGGGDDLRQRAEQLLAEKERRFQALPIERLQELMHELSVHQVELEMQNETLRATQADLEYSRDRYADLYDFAPVGYITLDRSGVILEINLTAASMLGVERSRLLGHPLVGFISPGGKNRFVAHLRRCAQASECEEVVGEVLLHSKSRGGSIPVQLRSAVVRDPHTGLISYRTALIDVSELRQSEQERLNATGNFAALADNMLQLAWMANEAGSIFWYNRRWYEFTGMTQRELDGWAWRKLLHPGHAERVVGKWLRHLDSGEQWEDTFPLRSRDGSYHWFLARANPIVDPQGHVLRWFGTNTDVTDRLQMEETLKEADRRKDAFLATLAHELRNPLAPIRSGLELLRTAPNDPGLTREVYDILEIQTGQLVRLVDDLLDVSRISRGVVELRTEQLCLAEVLDRVLQSARAMLEAAGQTVDLRMPDYPLLLRADPVRLSQVFSNLLHNAVKYTKAPGRIRIDVVPRDDEVDVRVRDQGIGIAAERLEQIFQMFVQGEAPLNRSHGGLGIGLTLCRSLVELHGGCIRADSAGVGQGSEFTVTLPLADGAVDRPETVQVDTAANQPPPRGSVAHRILVIDDNHNAADLLGMLLESRGHQVRVAYSGAEGLTVGDDFQPDLVLLDLGMPEMNGFATARAIRERPWGKTGFLVAITGWGQEQDRIQTAQAGFDAHLVKPVEHSELEALLNRSAS